MENEQRQPMIPSSREGVREGFSPTDSSLISCILEVIEGMPQHEMPAAVWSNRDYPRNMLLTLLTYCYFRGAWESGEIEKKAREEATVAYLCARRQPTAAILKAFRRGHRQVLENCVAEVFFRQFVPPGINEREAAELRKYCKGRGENHLSTAAALDALE